METEQAAASSLTNEDKLFPNVCVVWVTWQQFVMVTYKQKTRRYLSTLSLTVAWEEEMQRATLDSIVCH